MFLEWVDLTYDNIPLLGLSFQSPIEFTWKTHDGA